MPEPATGSSPPVEASPPPARRDRVRTIDYIQLDPHIFIGLIPVAVFLVVNQFWSAQLAIGLSFAASVVVFTVSRGRGAVRFLSILGFAIVTVSAVVGLVAESDRAFAAQNIVADFVFAAVFAGSAILRRPLIGAIAREAAPAIAPVMALDHPLFMRLSMLNAALNVATGIARIFLFDALSVNAYVIASRALGAPPAILFTAYCYFSITREAIRIWPADVEPPPARGARSGTDA